ncbi:hypothetical protein [Photorhabdus khanii]|uniref:Uncharacterized protein n=1 Tax=Photorhabdus khanii subsp. guanajuatensis TaxID=2100166 RepID=A0A4R4J4N5_9GAMM|nr:hypothetical protein [Photorhabdus khanii]TDB48500.1 hypothetical protein C5467_18895 [Photorhabdus khanii subsp. guanajuatensis]
MKLEQHEHQISIESSSNSNSVPITVWEPNLYPEGRWIDATTQRAGVLFKDSNNVTSAWDIVSVGGRKAFKAQTLSKPDYYGNCLGVATDTPVDARYCYCELDLFCNPYPDIAVSVLSNKTSASGTHKNIGYSYMVIHLTGGYKGKPQWIPSNISLGTSIDTATPYVLVANHQVNGLIQPVHFVGKQTDGIYKGQPTLGLPHFGIPLSYEWPKNTWSRWRIGLLAANNGTLIIEWYNVVADKWKIELCQYNMNTLMTGNLASGQIGIMYGTFSRARTIDQQNSLYRTPFDRAIFFQDF